MKKVGIALIVLQVIGVIGAFIGGTNPFALGLFGTIGYFLCGIIGVILIIISIKKQNDKAKSKTAHKPETVHKTYTPIKSNIINYNETKNNSNYDENKINKEEFKDYLIYTVHKTYTPIKSSIINYNETKNSSNYNENKINKEEFKDYLISKGYKEYTPKGLPSTVYQYLKSIENVLEWENLTWIGLAYSISAIRRKYDIGGSQQTLGELSHNTVINALKRFEEFIGLNQTN